MEVLLTDLLLLISGFADSYGMGNPDADEYFRHAPISGSAIILGILTLVAVVFAFSRMK
jgi:hypothetical protein